MIARAEGLLAVAPEGPARDFFISEANYYRRLKAHAEQHPEDTTVADDIRRLSEHA